MRLLFLIFYLSSCDNGNNRFQRNIQNRNLFENSLNRLRREDIELDDNDTHGRQDDEHDDHDDHDHDDHDDHDHDEHDDHDDHDHDDHDDHDDGEWSTAEKWGYATLANAFLVSLSLLGILLIKSTSANARVYVNDVFLGLAVSTMLGDAILHILPYIIGKARNYLVNDWGLS